MSNVGLSGGQLKPQQGVKCPAIDCGVCPLCDPPPYYTQHDPLGETALLT